MHWYRLIGPWLCVLLAQGERLIEVMSPAPIDDASEAATDDDDIPW